MTLTVGIVPWHFPAFLITHHASHSIIPSFPFLSLLMYRIRRDFLFLITSLLWGAVGALLIWRAFRWMSDESAAIQVQLVLTAGLGALAGYRVGFPQIVRENFDRIRSM